MSLLYEKKGAIAYLTINRPKSHNAVSPQTILDMLEAWKDYRSDDECRCAIITGAGDRSFCSGMDLGITIPVLTGKKKPENEAERKLAENPRLLDQATLRNFELYKPVIAAINGFAIAGGMELVQATDIRVASEKARFGLQESKWGLFPKGGSTVRLPRQIPYCKAMEIMLTGELFTAEEAYRLGFVNYVVPQDAVMEKAEEIAARILKNGPLSVRNIKQSVIECAGISISEGMDREEKLGDEVFASQDAVEGPRAFMEKREPKFMGK